jgi:signal peptidase I
MAVATLGIRPFVAQPFRVQQESMEPIVRPDQRMLADKPRGTWRAAPAAC